MCVAAMFAGFLFDLGSAPLSSALCGASSGLYDQAMLHIELFPTMHLAMMAGIVDVGRSQDGRWRRLLSVHSLFHFTAMAGGMVIGGAALMPLGAYLGAETNWWFMLAAMTTGTLAGGWGWSTASVWASGQIASELTSACPVWKN